MVLKNRSGNNMFIDLKNGVERMSKDVMSAAVRELPRAMKMASSEDIVNLVLSGANMTEIDRDDADDQLLTEVLHQQKDLNATIGSLRAKDKKQAALIAELQAELAGDTDSVE
jgi:hypothetical protein